MIDRPLGKEAAWRPRRARLAEEQIVRRLRQTGSGAATKVDVCRKTASSSSPRIISLHKINRALARFFFSTALDRDLLRSPGTLAGAAQSALLEIVRGKQQY
jgi:hypothetical protein